jgi:hypothetical protein
MHSPANLIVRCNPALVNLMDFGIPATIMLEKIGPQDSNTLMKMQCADRGG